MTTCRFFATALLLFGIQAIGVGQWPPKIAQPDSDVAASVQESLDRVVELGEIDTRLEQLGNLLSERLDGTPIFVDAKGVKMAELALSDNVHAKLEPLPLRSALRAILTPLGLRAVVEQEGLVITADFAALTRRGIAADRWIHLDAETARKFQQVLDAPFSGANVDRPLNEVVAEIGETTGLPLLIDARALEEIGLSPDQPVNLSLKDVPLRSFLNLLLRQLDLTYLATDDVLQITTIEAAEQNLQNRLYWLEGTGVPVGDFQSIIDLIQTSIVPDTWESLGGPSTLAPATLGNRNRPAILVSTTYPIHQQIEQLLEALREAHVGPDPVIATEKASPK